MKASAAYWYIEIVTALFVLLFLYTALDKLRDYTNFARALLHSPAIAHYARLLAVVVPAAEIITAILLILPRTRRLGLLCGTLLLLIFTLYVGFVLGASTELPCTCAGLFEHLSWRQHLLFNTSFLAMGIAALSLSHQGLTRINRSRRVIS